MSGTVGIFSPLALAGLLTSVIMSDPASDEMQVGLIGMLLFAIESVNLPPEFDEAVRMVQGRWYGIRGRYDLRKSNALEVTLEDGNHNGRSFRAFMRRVDAQIRRVST